MKQILLFYIGNSILKCALASFSPSKPPEILFYEDADIGQKGSLDKENLRATLTRSFEDLCQRSKKRFLSPDISNKKINGIMCLVSSPWYISETKVLKTTKSEPFLIKEDTISEFIEAARIDFEKEHQEKLMPLERKIIHLALNGYITNSPLHKKAQSLEVAFVQSFGDKDFLEGIRKISENYFTAKDYRFHSFSLASFVVMRDIYKQNDNFILINITGLLTEISLMKENVLHETLSLPIGFEKMIGIVALRLNVTREVALSLLKMHESGHAEEKITHKIDEALEEFKKEWNQYLGQAISHLSGGISIPSTCYLLCQIELSNFFLRFIEAEEYAQSFAAEKFSLKIIPGSSFSSFANFKNAAPDSSIAIASLFASKTFFNEGDLDHK